MTDDQIRVRISVTVTTRDGSAYRTSIIERIVNDESTNRIRNWTGTETAALFDAARNAIPKRASK